jgi:hypothetical protein
MLLIFAMLLLLIALFLSCAALVGFAAQVIGLPDRAEPGNGA